MRFERRHEQRRATRRLHEPRDQSAPRSQRQRIPFFNHPLPDRIVRQVRQRSRGGVVNGSGLTGSRQLQQPLARAIGRHVRQRGNRPPASLDVALLVAGGFDRSHSQQVRDVKVAVSPQEVRMHAVADEMPEVDVWGARRRAEFFEEMLDRPLVIEWEQGIVADVPTEAKRPPAARPTGSSRANPRSGARANLPPR